MHNYKNYDNFNQRKKKSGNGQNNGQSNGHHNKRNDQKTGMNSNGNGNNNGPMHMINNRMMMGRPDNVDTNAQGAMFNMRKSFNSMITSMNQNNFPHNGTNGAAMMNMNNMNKGMRNNIGNNMNNFASPFNKMSKILLTHRPQLLELNFQL